MSSASCRSCSLERHFPKQSQYRLLGDVSPVVRTLARDQFDDYVKRVRIFAHPRVAAELGDRHDLPELVGRAIDQTGD